MCHGLYSCIVTFFPFYQNVLDTRHSELHSLDELRSQFGQFKQSVLQELRPLSLPPNPQPSSGPNASSLHDSSAATPPASLPHTSAVPAPVGAGLESLRTLQDAAADGFLNTDDDEIDDEHSTFATHANDSLVHTPQRQSPGPQSAAQTMSPAEASKQALIIEKERDALLSSGLYLENGETRASA
jgi:hypothetical protein